MNLNDIRKIYFIGIGGIGMSALARYFHYRGAAVSGYDRIETVLTKKLAEEGMNIHYDEDIEKIPEGVDLVIYTPAVPPGHRELVYFREHGFAIKKRAEVLGIISRGMKCIAVAGTHGKTTTTTIITHLLRTGGVDCSAFLGGIARNFDSNFIYGQSEWVVVEADEYDRSFLHLSPDIAVITSLDADHLDIYGDRENMLETGFLAFAKKVEPQGQLWVQFSWIDQFADFKNVGSYGVEGGRSRSYNLRVEDGYFVFDYEGDGHKMEALKFNHPGKHNVENATAAITVALQLGVKPAAIREGLLTFQGIKRRFEFIVRNDRQVYIDDYAHHPSELAAAIDAARQLFPERKITGIFQPHLYSRTRDFSSGFAAALDALDEVILLDIYPARELPMAGVSSDIIFRQMKNPAKTLVDKSQLMDHLAGKEIAVLLTLGAGDIDTFVEKIKAMLQNSNKK